MTDDPQEILKAAGVECPEVEKFYRDYRFFRQKDVPWSAIDAIEALFRLVVKYKAMAEDIACGYDHNRANMDVARNSYTRVERIMSEAERRWEKHDATR